MLMVAMIKQPRVRLKLKLLQGEILPLCCVFHYWPALVSTCEMLSTSRG